MVAAGDLIDANDVVTARGIYAFGTAETQNNTTTLSTDLTLSLPSAGRWALEGVYFWRSPAAAGLKVQINGDAAGIAHATIRWGIEGNQTMQFGNGNLSITSPGSGFYRAAIWGIVDNLGGSAGTVTVQFAQTTANAGPTNPLSGRWLRALLLP